MPSCIVRVEIEVEVFYTQEKQDTWYPANQYQYYGAINAQCQTIAPKEVEQWAQETAMEQFERNPMKAIQEG